MIVLKCLDPKKNFNTKQQTKKSEIHSTQYKEIGDLKNKIKNKIKSKSVSAHTCKAASGHS